MIFNSPFNNFFSLNENNLKKALKKFFSDNLESDFLEH